jgi:hypothetical protein
VSAYEEIELPGQWGYTGTPWFLPVVGAWYRFLDRVDRALDR